MSFDFDAYLAGLVWILFGALTIVIGLIVESITGVRSDSLVFGNVAIVASQIWFAAGFIAGKIKDANHEVLGSMDHSHD